MLRLVEIKEVIADSQQGFTQSLTSLVAFSDVVTALVGGRRAADVIFTFSCAKPLTLSLTTSLALKQGDEDLVVDHLMVGKEWLDVPVETSDKCHSSRVSVGSVKNLHQGMEGILTWVRQSQAGWRMDWEQP
ncbi:hypothetical protein BTVI_38840 [Pitangus sulphuratus]|nr:hypothetical protein BTVI_38840 [Pitangus sulphuratus]